MPFAFRKQPSLPWLVTRLRSKFGLGRPEIERAASYSVRRSSIEWNSAIGESTCSWKLNADSRCAEVNVATLMTYV